MIICPSSTSCSWGTGRCRWVSTGYSSSICWGTGYCRVYTGIDKESIAVRGNRTRWQQNKNNELTKKKNASWNQQKRKIQKNKTKAAGGRSARVHACTQTFLTRNDGWNGDELLASSSIILCNLALCHELCQSTKRVQYAAASRRREIKNNVSVILGGTRESVK